MHTNLSITPETILAEHSPQVRAIAQKLRLLIINTIPDAIEKAYPGWHGIGYRHPHAGYFCGIFPMIDKVKLAFEYGAMLPDPKHLLQLPPTSSKQLRYIELRYEQDIPEEGIVDLLLAALLLKA